MAGKVAGENTSILSKSELDDMEEVEEDKSDAASDFSIQDDWSMVELTEEEKVETFKEGCRPVSSAEKLRNPLFCEI